MRLGIYGREGVYLWVDRGYIFVDRPRAQRLYESAVKSNNDDRAEHILDALTSPDGRPEGYR